MQKLWCYGTYQSHRIAKIVVYDNDMEQVITQDSFLAIIAHDQLAINFSHMAEVEDMFVIFAV